MDEISHVEELCTAEEKKSIISLLLRFLQCNRSYKIYSPENMGFINDVFLKNAVENLLYNDEKLRIDNQVIFLVRNECNKEEINKVVEKFEENNIIVVLNDTYVDGSTYKLTNANSARTISLYGPYFNIDKKTIPDSFKILAIIHVFNEADVINQTVEYLLSQGVDVFLIDNWSTDNSYELIKQLSNKYPKRVFFKRFPENAPSNFYDWYHQLELTERISKEADYSWYIHYDADEYRLSPWAETTLREAIYYIDSLGFNVIENTVIDFKITAINDNSIFMKDTWFDFGHRPAHFEQTKTWKKCESVDLKNSGGHIARVSNPKVFPLKILNRHYPFRSYEHAKRKIFVDRKPRFEVEKKERGWHGHYNKVLSEEDIVAQKDSLQLWGRDTFHNLYLALFTGTGIEIEKEKETLNIELLHLEERESVILYGAGKKGILLYNCLSSRYQIEAWVDKAYDYIQPMCGRFIESVDAVSKSNSRIVIAIENERIATDAIEYLKEMGVVDRRIIWKKELFEK